MSTRSPPTATDLAGGGDFSSILSRAIRHADSTTNNDNNDWTVHHVNYQLLSSTLDYFALRRSKIKSKLLFNNSTSTSSKCVISSVDYHRIIEECALVAPFRDEDLLDTVSATTATSTGIIGNRKHGVTVPGDGRRSDVVAASLDNTTITNHEDASTSNDIFHTQYHNMDTSTTIINNDNTTFTESQTISRLSYLERCQLSALLDGQVRKAATFYRHRVSLLSTHLLREEGMICGGANHLFCGDILQCATDGTDGNITINHNDNNNTIVGVQQQNQENVESVSIRKPTNAMARHTSLESNDLISTEYAEDINNMTSPSYYTNQQQHLASELLELHAFITTNLITIRQILIRYDAYVNSMGGSTMASWYITTRRNNKQQGRSGDYRDLVLHKKLCKLSRIYEREVRRMKDCVEKNGDTTAAATTSKKRKVVRRVLDKLVISAEEKMERQRVKFKGVMDMNMDDDTIMEYSLDKKSDLNDNPLESTDSDWSEMDLNNNKNNDDDVPSNTTRHYHIDSNAEDISYQIHIFKCIQSKTLRSIQKSSAGHISGWWDNTIATLRDYFLVGSSTDNLSLMPEYLYMRGKSLKRELLVVAQWREGRMAFLGGGDDTGNNTNEWFGGFCGETRPKEEDAKEKPSFKAMLALFMNILACFFYMMNYYIVEPSSTQYANALGMGDAMSGLIIGAMPWAAMTSAVIYSIWSNHNYRHPLLASGMLLMTGNLLYATAYRKGSIVMALCGRFLTGLGGPRSMNRRYIADTTPLAYRTSVNAAFGTATAMGAALGPATAIMIDSVDVQFDVPLYGTVYFNKMTGPGFIMCGLWILFTIILALTFEEPERSGLEEQKRKEMAKAQASASGGSAAALEMSKFGPSSKTLLTVGSDDFVTEQQQQPTQASATPYLDNSFNCTGNNPGLCIGTETFEENDTSASKKESICSQLVFVLHNLTVPVRICMFLLFSKMFTVESVISAASMVTKNRYGWQIQQVGTLGTIVGCLTIPISIFIGWISQYREDRVLMLYLMAFATLGMGLLVDVSDFFDTDTVYYNKGNPLAVGPDRYVAGYLLVFCSVQAFDGVVGSVLSKVIPTALATGTLNSGLLATVVGTFGRACGDVFITSVGFIDLRNVMNMLYIPSFCILLLDLIIIWWNYDALTA